MNCAWSFVPGWCEVGFEKFLEKKLLRNRFSWLLTIIKETQKEAQSGQVRCSVKPLLSLKAFISTSKFLILAKKSLFSRFKASN